ncbi:MAG: YfhO family protein [Chloroflexi bacterium]|nr:YfhO family protein [Chloroflexota bacterium]
MFGPITVPRHSTGTRLSADAGAVALLLLATLGYFAILAALGLTYYEDDIVNEYYPLLQYLLGHLAQGDLSLWSSRMFLGYPFFADGTAGTLYPLNWLAFLVPAQQSITFLLALGTALSALFFYLFARSLRLSPPAALLASLAYAFSGYNVGHWIHLSLAHSMLTLPLALWAVERACRSRGRTAVAWLLLAALALGLMWLGIHPQSAFISTLCLGIYALFRVLFTDLPGSLRRRFAWLVGGGSLVTLAGAGLAAAQMWPMAEMAMLGPRGLVVDYEFASSHALPWHNLVTAIWPFAFVTPGGFDWGLTNRWEVAFYIGIVPLALAVFGLAGRRDRYVVFWGILGLLGLWLALAEFAPLNLHGLVYALPGFSSFRVPGRFLQLTDFAWPLLAGYGLDQLRAPAARDRLRPWAARLAGGLVGIVALLAVANLLVLALPGLLPRVLWPLYMNWPHETLWRAEQVWPALRQTLNFANPRWLLWSALALLGAGLLWAWRGRSEWPGWTWLLVALTALDLLLFAGHFWEAGPTSLLAGPGGAVVDYLRQHGQGDRVWSVSRSTTDYNRLLNEGLDEVNSYGPLEMQRYYEFTALAQRTDNALADLLAVRWLVVPLADSLPFRAGGIGFDIRRPLAVVSPQQAVPTPVYRAGRPVPASAVRLVGRLAHAGRVPQGQTVAELLLKAPDGRQLTLPVRAGLELAENDALRPDIVPQQRHNLPPVVLRERARDATGRPFDRLTYMSDLRVPGGPFPVSEITLRPFDQEARLVLYGYGLVGPDGALVGSDQLTDSRYVERARDGHSRLLERLQVPPRVFLAAKTRVVGPGEALAPMADHLSDPAQEVYVEASPGQRFEAGPSGGQAVLTEETSTRLVVAIAPERPTVLFLAEPFNPGWRASVDGQPAPIYWADHVFRAVPVRPGQKEVVLTYEPRSVRWGFAISGATALLLASSWLWLISGSRTRPPAL